jgi:phytoene synthase
MTQAATLPAPASGDAAQAASGSSFYAAMRILPKRQRAAMFEIYAFCRAVDDIADDPGPAAGRIEALQQWRDDIVALYAERTPVHLRPLKAAVAQFRLRREDFFAVIDGMEMDVRGPIRAPDLATLDLYCDRVASAVGRLSVRVFGLDDEAGIALAHHLGRALQLTNILRDLDEDAEIGRLYLPGDILRHNGITTLDPAAALADPNVAKVCRFIADKARDHFREADSIMRKCRRRRVRAPRIMAEAYRLILDGLTRRGFAPPRRRVRVAKPRFLWILLRHAF